MEGCPCGSPHVGLPLASSVSALGAPRRPGFGLWTLGMAVGQGHGHEYRCRSPEDTTDHDELAPPGRKVVAELAGTVHERRETVVGQTGAVPLVPQVSCPARPDLEPQLGALGSSGCWLGAAAFAEACPSPRQVSVGPMAAAEVGHTTGQVGGVAGATRNTFLNSPDMCSVRCSASRSSARRLSLPACCLLILL